MSLGWGQFFGGLGRLFDKLPIQGRRERWRNEVENLKKEKEQLLKGEANEKKVKRLDFINSRLEYVNQLLRNAEKD